MIVVVVFSARLAYHALHTWHFQARRVSQIETTVYGYTFLLYWSVTQLLLYRITAGLLISDENTPSRDSTQVSVAGQSD